jgi:hypothetical protein
MATICEKHSSSTNLPYSSSLVSKQETQPEFLTQRSEMLPAPYIPIQKMLNYCFPNQLLTHFFQL